MSFFPLFPVFPFFPCFQMFSLRIWISDIFLKMGKKGKKGKFRREINYLSSYIYFILYFSLFLSLWKKEKDKQHGVSFKSILEYYDPLYTFKTFFQWYIIFFFFAFREKKREMIVRRRRIGLFRKFCFDRVPSIRTTFLSFSLFSLFMKNIQS